MNIKESSIFRVFEGQKGKRILMLTESLVNGQQFFLEDIIKDKGKEFRTFDPSRSKLAAAIMKGAPNVGIREGNTVLYLGASHGYTPSFVSDMVGKTGFVFCLDFAPRVVRDLIFVCEQRENMCPLFFDAHFPEQYKDKIVHPVDIVYMDVAQRDQAEIFLKNVKLFLKKGGYGLLALKARSVDVTRMPNQVFEEVRRKLENEIKIIDSRKLDPFEKDHMMFICKKD